MKIIKQNVKLLWVTPNAEEEIEKAARLCYQSKVNPDTRDRFIRGLIKSGYESVIEHASASFLITTNRAIANEIVRHRLASYSQISTRYVAYRNKISVIQPYGLNTKNYHLWVLATEKAEETYKKLLKNGEKPEIARDVLPLCLATQLTTTANFREWRHFIKLRTSKKAHPQIRIITGWIDAILSAVAPSVF